MPRDPLAERFIIEENVFDRNTAGRDGGAIYSEGANAVLEIENSTFNNNTADVAGSAINVSHGSSPNASLTHVTIVGNSSETLFDLTTSGTVRLRNSILYNLGSGAACAGTLDENTNSIIEDGSCSNPANLSVNPQLGAFTGSYYPLLAGSPAIDAADASQCLSRDQRGARRPAGGGCDIGAYEFGGASSSSRSKSAPQREPETVNEQTVQHNEQVITEHGYKVTLPHGLETIAFKALNPEDCGAIGNQAVCDMDVLQVADISGWAEQGIRFCFKGYGKVLFLPSHDANGVAINQQTAHPETLPVELVDGMTCVTIYRTGKLVLLESDEPPTIITQTQQEPEPVWEPVPVTQCGHRTQADGSVVHVVQSGHHCWAIAEACGIYVEDIQQLNPEFGDCRMLHPGDELVVSVPPSPTDGVSLSVEPEPAVDKRSINEHNERIFRRAFLSVYTDSEVTQKIWLELCRLPASVSNLELLPTGQNFFNFAEFLEHHRDGMRSIFADLPQDAKWEYADVERELLEHFDEYYAGQASSTSLPSAADIICPALDRAQVDAVVISIYGDIVTALFYEDSYTHLPALHTAQQVEEAAEQLEEWGIAICDVVSSFGLSSVTTVKKEVIHTVYEESIEYLKGELRAYLLRKVAEGIVESEQLEEEGKELVAGILATGLVIGDAVDEIPTGPCSAVATFMKAGAALADGRFNIDQLVRDVIKEIRETSDELLDKSTNCTVNTGLRTVPVRRLPNASESPVAKVVGVDLNPVGVVESDDGKKFYVFNGTLGPGWRAIGTTATVISDTLAPAPAQTGIAFVDIEDLESGGNCDNLPNLTEVYKDLTSLNRESLLLDPKILAVPEPDKCNYIIKRGHNLCQRRERGLEHLRGSNDCEYTSEGDYIITKYVPGEDGMYVVDRNTGREGWLADDNFSLLRSFFMGEFSLEFYLVDETGERYTGDDFSKTCTPEIE